MLKKWFVARHRKASTGGDDASLVKMLDMSRVVGYPLTLYIAAWRSITPFAWHSLSDDERLACGDFLASPGIDWTMLQARQDESLLAGMPKTVRTVMSLAPFISIELAQVCGRLSAARELAANAPLILIMLVKRGVENAWTPEYLAHLLAKKQADLCSAAGVLGTKSCARLIKRCRLRVITRGELAAIRRALTHEPNLAALRHYDRPCLEHLLFLAHFDGGRWPGLPAMIDELLPHGAPGYQRPPVGSTARLQSTLKDVERMLGRNDRRPERTDSLAALNRLHERLVERFNATHHVVGQAPHPITLLQRHGFYPDPPLPGNEHIDPIISWSGLLQEGKTMRHCVGAYHGAVAIGQVAIYHLYSPEPATVALRPQGSVWVLSEASGKSNTTPSAEAMDAIQTWLALQTE